MTLNVLHMAFTLSAVFTDVLSNISFFTSQVEGVLVSHFLLDLQSASRRTLRLSRDDPLNFETTWSDGGGTGSLSFARVIGSLGSPIEPDSSDGDTDTIYGGYVSSEDFELKTPVRETAEPDQQHPFGETEVSVFRPAAEP
ncbi:hypothetical protein L227DRAFT_400236 [Lentinus tigrinus ALCF2SS1-6]|uniref:Uncharacterized protein n=1 Tax=Lentinus tigrinus ALCF2SS1-6 TaxID=1328759 RepID=A0A5C2RP24_9APHY|nr:hypothetical protein L227DRAFT_400236 [Lentinus tigrinus ALCF2SS1-6]